jgi:hypothetical protein
MTTRQRQLRANSNISFAGSVHSNGGGGGGDDGDGGDRLKKKKKSAQCNVM